MMLNHIIDPKTNRMNLFSGKTEPMTSTISYGHDIEASLADIGSSWDFG
jgi:hypothetical protein